MTVRSLHPYIAVADGRRAITWYVEALGARLTDDPIEMPDGSIGHAELDIDGQLLMLAEGYPPGGIVPPGDTTTVTLYLDVDDADAVTDRALNAGAELERPVEDQPFGRIGVFRDPFGHRWMVHSDPPG